MKKTLILSLLLIPVIAILAQGYKSRVATPDEERKLAGVTDWIQDGPRMNFTEFIPGEQQVITLQPTNNVVLFTSVGALTNCVVLLPNATNSTRRVYRLICNGNVSLTLSNTSGNSFSTGTNTVAGLFFTTTTNRSLWVYNRKGTNWFVDPDLP